MNKLEFFKYTYMKVNICNLICENIKQAKIEYVPRWLRIANTMSYMQSMS